MSKYFEGRLLGEGLKFGVVVSRFNEFITKKLLDGARDALLRHGVGEGRRVLDATRVEWPLGARHIPRRHQLP